MKKILLGLGLTTTIVILATGCGGSQLAKAIQPEVELAQSSEITENINKYTDSLDNLNEMLILYSDPVLHVSALEVLNKTAQGTPLPDDITIMVNSALNEIGDQVIAYKNPGQLDGQGIENSYIIEGAITEYDVLERSNRGMNLAVHAGKGKGEADANTESTDDDSTAKLTIDFNVINAQTGAYVAKVHTSNSIKIVKKSASADLGFSIMGSGFGLNASMSREQGKHAALRLLVDLSMVELIGKLQKEPYWICVPGAKKDRRLQRDIKREFTRKYSVETQVFLVNRFLNLVGMPEDVSGIIQYKKQYGVLPINGDITAELYMSLLMNAKGVQEQKSSASKSQQMHNNML